MATVTGFTADRMKQIEDTTVVDGDVVGDNLVLRTRAGSEIAAGNVRGPRGLQGIPGSITASPAGGVLSGNYPNPALANDAITADNVASGYKDGAPGTASLRTLGTSAQQAAAGDHKHGDTDWITISQGSNGATPFNTRDADFFQYRKFGPLTHVRLAKRTTAAVDRSANTGGNFPNVLVVAPGTIPVALRPSQTVPGTSIMAGAPQGVVMPTDGSIVWLGGFARNYPANAVLTVDFVYFSG